MTKKIGVYPGTFDPITAGHLDIIERALTVVDEIYVAIAIDSIKNTMFSFKDRIDMIQNEVNNSNIDASRIKVRSFNGLLVKYAEKVEAKIIIRGLRAVSDFEYEFQMSCMNTKLSNNIQTIFLPASEKMQLVSSRLVKEVVRLGGDAHEFASREIQEKIRRHFNLDE